MTEGTLQAVECEPIEFANDFFIRGKMELLQHIKRKDAKARTTQRDIVSKKFQKNIVVNFKKNVKIFSIFSLTVSYQTFFMT